MYWMWRKIKAHRSHRDASHAATDSAGQGDQQNDVEIGVLSHERMGTCKRRRMPGASSLRRRVQQGMK
jgi:hypothetical protein